jgi:hypothetical protein
VDVWIADAGFVQPFDGGLVQDFDGDFLRDYRFA